MQYQKEEVRQNIIASATDEFLQSGYNSARINDIAVSADVPIGNLYRYFEGKAQLFEAVVGEAYTVIPTIIASWSTDNADKPANEVIKALTGGIVDLFNKYGTQLIILMDKSQGSAYQDFGEKLSGMIHTYVKESVFKSQGDDFFCMIISNALLHTALDILRKGEGGSYEELINRAWESGLSSLF